ncbi:hypothetical protein D187_003515 [Cystobacter fuscus DSM 2262]|uniref:Outer membrane protein beta-barrel domain-containing protein n=1 Tax=Cystobacter fuscus (strain ATCC 25194 / DSM 2262 / NBRC 100088 / M29) TaxID=1242864 RepID=S9P2V7_CYSF2|nr:hypothetical protein [Cystobacter fuscus]EPX58800.1 hypothetical protein D187_003515 [Cystobacter fuscus DSM 2262]
MRTFSRWMALAVLVGGPAAYAADRNDIELSKLGKPGENSARTGFSTDSDFRAFARTLGAMMTATNLTPPETLGHAGFAVGMELGVVGMPDEVKLPMVRALEGPALVPSIHVRKGLPFSIDVGARVGWLDRSNLFAATGEVKWAVNEGFIPWLPDIGLRAHVTHLLNTRDFHLTAGGLDVNVGKQFPLGGMISLTPYGGIDFVGVAAKSELLGFTPSGATGPLTVAAYEPVNGWDNINTRFYAGGRFIGGALQLGAEVSLSSQGTIQSIEGGPNNRALAPVFAFSTTLGLDF